MPRILHLVPVAKPEDTASFAWYLASDECPVVTGGVFPVDSGLYGSRQILTSRVWLTGDVKQWTAFLRCSTLYLDDSLSRPPFSRGTTPVLCTSGTLAKK
jgi:hypothetical protein